MNWFLMRNIWEFGKNQAHINKNGPEKLNMSLFWKKSKNSVEVNTHSTYSESKWLMVFMTKLCSVSLWFKFDMLESTFLTCAAHES